MFRAVIRPLRPFCRQNYRPGVTKTPGQAIPTPCTYNLIHKLHSGMSCVQDFDSNISCVQIVLDNWIAECVVGVKGSGMSGDIEEVEGRQSKGPGGLCKRETRHGRMTTMQLTCGTDIFLLNLFLLYRHFFLNSFLL